MVSNVKMFVPASDAFSILGEINLTWMIAYAVWNFQSLNSLRIFIIGDIFEKLVSVGKNVSNWENFSFPFCSFKLPSHTSGKLFLATASVATLVLISDFVDV